MQVDAEINTSTGTDTVTSIVEFLKAEHLQCLDNGDLWDANEIQHTILGFLEEVRTENAATMVERCREKITELFGDLHQKAVDQNRWDTADHYQAVSSMYSDG